MNDLELDGSARTPALRRGQLTGVFDGGGHTITGFQADPGIGSGLFAANDGVIRNLSVAGAVKSNVSTAGIRATSTAAPSKTAMSSGTITAPSRVGGLVGDSYGIVRDCYSTADVHSWARRPAAWSDSAWRTA